MDRKLLDEFEQAVRELVETECEIEHLDEMDRSDWSAYQEAEENLTVAKLALKKIRKKILEESNG